MQTTLAEILRSRGSLTPGQVVTVGVAIARELAALHAAGHVYAGVTADAVVVDADGRPTLAPATEGGGQPADDVRELSGVLRAAAGPDAGLALLRVLGAPVDAATGFARDLYAVCPPEPLLVSEAHRVPATRRMLPRGRRAALLLVAAVVAGFAGVASARSSAHRATTVVAVAPAHSAPTPTPDWRAVLSRLDAMRDAAFATVDAAALRRVYVAGSVALSRDEAALRDLAVHHARARGLQQVLVSVVVLRLTATSVTLHVVDRMPAYDVVDEQGRILTHQAKREPHAWHIVLMVGGGYRIATIN